MREYRPEKNSVFLGYTILEPYLSFSLQVPLSSWLHYRSIDIGVYLIALVVAIEPDSHGMADSKENRFQEP